MKKILIGLMVLSSMAFGEVVKGGKDEKGSYMITQNKIEKYQDLKKESSKSKVDIVKWIKEKTEIKGDIFLSGGSHQIDVKTLIVTRKYYVKIK